MLWRVLGPPTPPIFDSFCPSAQYLHIGDAPAPLAASRLYPAGQDFPTSEVVTGEMPPQAQLLLMSGTFASANLPLNITIEPVQPPAAAPAGWTLDSNAYAAVATGASGRHLQPQANQPVTVLLRAATSQTTVSMFVWDGARWNALTSLNAGCGDTFEAASPSLGVFALYSRAGQPSSPPQTGVTVAIVVASIAVLAAALIGLLRIARRRR